MQSVGYCWGNRARLMSPNARCRWYSALYVAYSSGSVGGSSNCTYGALIVPCKSGSSLSSQPLPCLVCWALALSRQVEQHSRNEETPHPSVPAAQERTSAGRLESKRCMRAADAVWERSSKARSSGCSASLVGLLPLACVADFGEACALQGGQGSGRIASLRNANATKGIGLCS